MSVTFNHSAEPIISGWYVECGCGKWRSVEFATREEAVAVMNDHGCDDDMCVGYPAYPTPVYVGVVPIELNFSNRNARHILSLLGVFDEELCGSMPIDDFERALVLAEPTSGVPTRTTVNVGGELVTVEGTVSDTSAVRVIECGRDAGYDTRALSALRRLLDQAKELHAEAVCWG